LQVIFFYAMMNYEIIFGKQVKKTYYNV